MRFFCPSFEGTFFLDLYILPHSNSVSGPPPIFVNLFVYTCVSLRFRIPTALFLPVSLNCRRHIQKQSHCKQTPRFFSLQNKRARGGGVCLAFDYAFKPIHAFDPPTVPRPRPAWLRRIRRSRMCSTTPAATPRPSVSSWMIPGPALEISLSPNLHPESISNVTPLPLQTDSNPLPPLYSLKAGTPAAFFPLPGCGPLFGVSLAPACARRRRRALIHTVTRPLLAVGWIPSGPQWLLIRRWET